MSNLRRPWIYRCGSFFAIGSCIAASACAGGDSSTPLQPASVRFDTVDGVVHVRNEGGGLWLPRDRWTVREIRQIGSMESPAEESLTSTIVSTIPGRAGRTLVLDHRAARLLEFDENGEFLGEIGRRGEGPGEFRSPTGVASDRGGSVWVADFFGPRYTAFAPDGSLRGIYRRPIRVTLAKAQQLHVGPGDEVLDFGVVSRSGGGQGLMFTKTRPPYESVDTAWIVDMPSRGSVGSRPVRPNSAFSLVVRHYLQVLVWTPGSDGSLWVAPTGGAQLVNLSAEGDTLRVVHVSHRPRPLTNDEEDLIAAAARETGLARSAFEVVPGVIQFLRVTDDGYLLVFVKADPVDSASMVEVYDPDGRFLGLVDLGFEIPRLGVAGLRGDTLAAPIVGPLDATFVIKAVIERPRG